MIKKSIVMLQLATAVALAVLIIGQIGISPERAKHINKKAPLWFMNPWRIGDVPREGPDLPDQARQTSKNDAARIASIRRAVLSPSPALDALLAELESKDLESAGPVLIPAKAAPPSVEAQPKTRPAQTPRKKPAPAPAGPQKITSLQIVPAAGGVRISGTTAAPLERMDLYTYVSPPRMILELYGNFAPYGQAVSIPPNPIIQSVTTEVTPNKLRIVGTLLTDKATVAPVSQVAGRNSFAVELTTAGGQAAPASTR